MYEKFYVHEIAAVDLSKICFLKNAKKTFKPNNRNSNRDWKKVIRCSKQRNVILLTFTLQLFSNLFISYYYIRLMEGSWVQGLYSCETEVPS